MQPKDAQKYPVQGRVILKSKNYWLCWIYKDGPCLEVYDNWNLKKQRLNKGFIVAPRTIYLYNIYIAKSFWDALKYFIKISFKKNA
jgi:hypothetical protein